jgi:glycosyltransferase involved in cell wall biosynthesis
VGYDLSRKYKLKLVCDQHEFYSNWIVRTRHYNTGLGKLIRFLSNWDKYEDKYLRKADMVITVEESLRKLYIEKLQIDPSKIVTLPNTPQSQVFNPTNIDPSILDKYKSRFVLFYGGSLDHLRGLDFIAQAVAELKNDIDSLLFLVAGKENKTFSMQELIMKYGIGEVTDYVGWVPLAKLPSYVSASRICLFVPIADNLEINNTVATKIYQYAAMGKPVIVSEARLMRKFVEENRIGFSVNFGDIHGFCEIVRNIYRNPEICSDIKQRAMEVAGHYTWENTSRLFTRFYTHLTS